MAGGSPPVPTDDGEGWNVLAPEGGWVVQPGRNSIRCAVVLTAPERSFCLKVKPEPGLWRSPAFVVPPNWNETGVANGQEVVVELFSADPTPVRIPPKVPVARIVPTSVWTDTVPIVLR